VVAAEQLGAKTKKRLEIDPLHADTVRLKAIRDQSQADTMRTRAALESAAQQPITTTVLRKFAATARRRMRIDGGGYRRDHLRALARRVEVADREVRIMGSKSDLLRTLAAICGAKIGYWRRSQVWTGGEGDRHTAGYILLILLT
jgi:hypothetical protein